ncbi:uncharacterized protein LOC144666037 [Oculina patagonica]
MDIEKGTARFSIKSFQEKMNKLKRDLKETEEKVNTYKQETLAARWREHNAKHKMKEMSEKITEVEDQIKKIESKIAYQNGRRKEIAEKYRENGRVTNELEGSTINIEEMMRKLHDTQQRTIEVRRMNKGMKQVAEILEPKIEKAEKREQKAVDRAFLISQKLTVHRYLAAKRPEGLPAPEEDFVPHSDQEAKVLALREKIKGAILRKREAERKRSGLERKMQVMEDALENYKRRNQQFQISKRELMSSNFY